MELRQLTYFLVLCERLHFSQAAEELGISQPTLSQQIRVLEDEFGTPLFDRIGKKTIQTEAGLILQRNGQEIMELVRNTKLEINDLLTEHTGHLKVAVLPSDLDYRLPPLIEDFHNKYPRISLNILSSVHIIEKVVNHEVDLGIALAGQGDNRLTEIPFYEESYALFVSEKHSLAHVESVTAKQLQHLNMMLYQQGFAGRKLLEQWAEKEGISFNVLLEASTVTALFELVRRNVGVTIQPVTLQRYFQEGIVIIPIRSEPSRQLAIYYHKNKFISRATNEFIQASINHFN